MSNYKTLTTLASLTIAASLFASTAFAQDAEQSPMIEPTPTTEALHFASSDLDQDGVLNADEFVTFAVMQAESGNKDFQDVVVSGEYKPKFTAHDTDASGGLSPEELGQVASSKPMLSDDMKSDEIESETDMTDTPDLN